MKENNSQLDTISNLFVKPRVIRFPKYLKPKHSISICLQTYYFHKYVSFCLGFLGM